HVKPDERSLERQMLQEEQRSMEMLEPVPTPPAPAVRAHEEQQRERPHEEESVSREQTPYIANVNESPQVAPGEHGRQQTRRRHEPVGPPRRPQNENQQRRELQNDEVG